MAKVAKPNWALSLFFVCAFSFSALARTTMTYHGRLTDPSGNAVTASNVKFLIQIRTPGTENCILYEELQTLDLSSTKGGFSFVINSGSGTRRDSSGVAIEDIFSNNRSYTFSSGQCASGTTFTPSSDDSRNLYVYFNDGSFASNEWEALPATSVSAVARSIDSMRIGGYPATQLIRVANGVSQTQTELSSGDWTKLLDLIAGTSAQYASSTASMSVSGAVTSLPSGTGAGQTGQFIMRELVANGTNTYTIKAPDSITADRTLILPDSNGTTGQVLSTNGSGVTTWVTALTSTTGFINGGNSFGATSTIGNNDAFDLNFETNGVTRMTLGNTANTYTMAVASNKNTGVVADFDDNASGRTAGSILQIDSDSADNAGYNLFKVMNQNTASTKFLVRGDGNVGVGTTNPTAVLHVETGSVLFNGVSGNTPISGAGTRLMWIPSKAAFRAGSIDSTQWDDANIGTNSVAMGDRVQATGTDSVALGGLTRAGATSATAVGWNSLANGNYSVSVGSGVVTSGSGSVGIGWQTSSTGLRSTAFGVNARVSGTDSIAIGAGLASSPNPIVSGNNSIGFFMGDQANADVTASNVMSILGGNVGIGTASPGAFKLNVNGNGYFESTLEVTDSIVGGGPNDGGLNNSFVAANFSPSVGSGSRVRWQTYNSGYSSVVDNGAIDVVMTANAVGSESSKMSFLIRNSGLLGEKMTLLNNGNVGIGTTNPATTLQVAGVISPSANNTYSLGNSTYRFTELYATNGTVNTSDLREKKDIKESNLGLDFIKSLRPVSYRWNTGLDSDVHYGFIAQEVEQVINRSLASENEKTSIVTYDESADRYGVRYSELIGPIVKSIQQLYHRLTRLENEALQKQQELASKASRDEIEQLKSENAALKKYLCEKDNKAPFCR